MGDLENIKIDEDIKIIASNLYDSSDITSVLLPENLLGIEQEAFSFNSIKNIELPNNLIYINDRAFFCNNLENIIFPESLLKIGDSSFESNKLKSITLNNGIKEIGIAAFSNNFIESLEIPESIEIIKKNTFKSNKISSIKLHEGLRRIESEAFYNNCLEHIFIPSTVEYIGNNAFDNIEIEYKNYTFTKEFVSKFGCHNIINAFNILEIFPNYKFNNLDSVILEIIPKDNDSIKGFDNNYKIFQKLRKELKIKVQRLFTNNTKVYKNFYKLCHIMGLFNTGSKKQEYIINIIKEMYSIYTIYDIHDMINNIKLVPYNSKIGDIILTNYDNFNLKETLSLIYNDYNNISKNIIKNRKEQIGILNSKFKKNPNEEIKEKIDRLKKLKNKIIIDEYINYLNTHVFDIRYDAKELEQISSTLGAYLNQEQFNKIQDLYVMSKKIEKEKEKIFTPLLDKTSNNYNYEWLSGDNPINIILGYICDCCSKYEGLGMDIMVQSMINPQVKVLVIRDSKNNIIAKTTAYYNITQKYIIFNNIEIKEGFMYNKNILDDDRKELLNTILMGIKDQVLDMKKRGYEVNDIRMGMDLNDLDYEIREKFPVVHDNLLDNYHYDNYEGNANDKKEGQAVIKIK